MRYNAPHKTVRARQELLLGMWRAGRSVRAAEVTDGLPAVELAPPRCNGVELKAGSEEARAWCDGYANRSAPFVHPEGKP
jgi:hypothetical protein